MLLRALAFATLLALALGTVPVRANDLGCANAGVQCHTVIGPAKVQAKGVAAVGAGFCQDANIGLPLFCPAGTDLGSADFDARGFPAGLNDELMFWAKYQNQLPCNALAPVCGFYIEICNDRDLDAVCTNTDEQHDQIWTTYSGTSVLPGCPDKDNKNCGISDDDASATVCAMPALDGKWHDDQILVFVGSWAGAAPVSTNTGMGLSAGTYNVEMKDDATSCTPGGGGGLTASDGCIWHSPTYYAGDDLFLNEVTDQGPHLQEESISGHTGACAGTFSCAGKTLIVVFVLGVGTTTANGACTFFAPLTATSPGNAVNANVAFLGTYTCSYTWFGAPAAGGCFTV